MGTKKMHCLQQFNRHMIPLLYIVSLMVGRAIPAGSLILALLAFIIFPTWAVAGSVEGSVQGLTCVTVGKLCPTGKEDPMAALEKVFVVLTRGKSFYFVPNVDRTVLARHINDTVRVTGRISSKYSSIAAEKIEVFIKGAWKTTWTYSMESSLMKLLETTLEEAGPPDPRPP